MRVVSDTGPVNYLALIGCTDILPTLFGTVTIPTGVERELRHSETPPLVRTFMDLAPPWLLVRSVPVATDPTLAHLDAGEREVILLARALGADLVLMDDRLGVAAARSGGLAATGTLGLLDRAKRRGLLDIGDAVARLRKTSFRCRPVLYDELLSEHREG